MRQLLLAAGTVLVSALAAPAGCASEGIVDFSTPCRDVVCANGNEYVACDETDAVCKCGPFELDLVCGDDEVCAPAGENAFACISTRCELVLCDRGERCHPASGACVCGDSPGARACEGFQTCESGRCVPESRCDGVTCDPDAACDPADGTCRCGGVECGSGERCVHGACTFDPCFGVNCPDATVCNPGDGLCHCGDAAGEVCLAGQACAGRACVAPDPCSRVTCVDGAVCDASGVVPVCRCGGAGPQFPPCGGPAASCTLGPTGWRCLGGGHGDPCVGRDCAAAVPGSSCDPEDGKCKCGGLDGLVCEGPGRVCGESRGERVCERTCDPLGPSTCLPDEACMLDLARGLATCLVPGDGPQEGPCRGPLDCLPGSFCPEGGARCRELCDLDPPEGEPNGCPDTKICSPLPNAPDPRLGQCLVPG